MGIQGETNNSAVSPFAHVILEEVVLWRITNSDGEW